MKLRHLFAVACLGPLAADGRAFADMIDQSQPLATESVAAFHQTDLAQSFQQAGADITGADILLAVPPGSGTSTADITIALYDALPTQGGNLLATGTDYGVGAGQYATVSWGQVGVTPNTTYYLVFTSTDGSFVIAGASGDPYPRGETFANPGYHAYPTYDYAFDTFAASPAPEPSSVALLGLGVLGIAAHRRRSRRRAAGAA